MHEDPFIVALFFLIFAGVGFGIFAIAWPIASALSARIGRPNKEGFRYAGVWTICAWCVTSIPAVIMLRLGHSGGAMLGMVLLCFIASISGACYGYDKPEEN